MRRSYPSIEEAEQYLEGLEAEIALSGNQRKMQSKKLIMMHYRPGHESGAWQSGMRTAWAVAFDLMGMPIEPRAPYSLVTRSYIHYPVPEKDDGS